MDEKLTIGRVSGLTGVPARTIRFYEQEGLLPPPRRGDNGYRSYSPGDVVRLRLVQKLRLLDLSLPAIRALADQAFAADCASFGVELSATIRKQRESVDRRLAELQALRSALDELNEHIDHCCEGCDTEQMAAECDFCVLITDQEGGDTR